MDKLASLDAVLDKYIPADELGEVKRILYGYNRGALVPSVPLSADGIAAAEKNNYDLKAYKFSAAPEEMRAPRIVKIALIQHSISHPTTDPVSVQVPLLNHLYSIVF